MKYCLCFRSVSAGIKTVCLAVFCPLPIELLEFGLVDRVDLAECEQRRSDRNEWYRHSATARVAGHTGRSDIPGFFVLLQKDLSGGPSTQLLTRRLPAPAAKSTMNP